MNKVNTKIDDDFDFGFSAVDEKEIEAVKEIETKAQSQHVDVLARMRKMYDMIVPLLNNLAKNPDKEYIKWPDRQKKLEQFRKKLDDLMNA